METGCSFDLFFAVFFFLFFFFVCFFFFLGGGVHRLLVLLLQLFSFCVPGIRPLIVEFFSLCMYLFGQ